MSQTKMFLHPFYFKDESLSSEPPTHGADGSRVQKKLATEFAALVTVLINQPLVVTGGPAHNPLSSRIRN